jgi:putative ABC transport system permease protein
MSLLGRASRRYHLRHPAQFGLALAGVAVGVAVVVAIDLANESARRSFRLATVATAGAATHQVTAADGDLDELLLARIRIEGGVRAAAPVVDDAVLVGPPPGRALRLLGVDPWSEGPFRGFLSGARLAAETSQGTGPGGGSAMLVRFLTEPGAALLERTTAERLGVALGGELEVGVAGRRERLRVVGLLDPDEDGSRAALANLALVDLATAQELLDRPGRLTRIDLALPDDDPATAPALERLARLLPPGVAVSRAASRPETLEQMTRAFRFNLRALSLLALLCGSFLIYNALTFSVVQRRDLFGRLRAVGLRRGEILALLFGEAVVLGALGGALGLALGVVLGRGLTALVLTTIRDLYFSTAAEGFALPAASLARGMLLGVAAAIAAAVVPAIEAAASPPRATLLRSELETRVQRLAGIAALAGVVFAACGALLFALSAESLPLSLAAFFLVLLGTAFAIPWLLARCMGRAARLFAGSTGGSGFYLRTAARAVGAALSRTGVAVAALALAVSVSIAVAVMIGSFRRAVEIWLDTVLVGDLYVSTPSRLPNAAHLRIPEATIAAIRALPGVDRVNTLRTLELQAPGEPPARVVGLDLDARGRAAFVFKEGEPEEIWRTMAARSDAAILAEPFAYRRGLHAGDTFELATPAGRKRFYVAGVDYDYGSDQGVALFTAESFRAHFGEHEVAVLAVFARDGTKLSGLARAIESAAPPGALEVQESATLKAMSVQIFDRTFAITGVLRLLAIAVAVLGILAALAAYELDRGRELALLRALGLTRRQLLLLVGAETAWIGLAAGLFALPLGALLAALMVHVINRRSFGWSMELLLPARPFVEALGLALLAALAAGLVPALRLARADPATALREE